MSIRLISRAEITQLLPMRKAIELMREGFGSLAGNRVLMPPRQRLVTADGDMLLKPACLPGEGLCVKLVMTYPGNPEKGLPLVQGLMMVFDDITGCPLAVMEAGELTAIRTGAGSGLAIDLLARKDSRTVALIGAGVQGRTQLLAAMEVRPIDRVFLFDLDPNAAQRIESEMAAHGKNLKITQVATPDEGVAQADIVITATTSPVPTFSGSALRPGTHVNAVGAYQPDRREVDEEAMRRSYVVVDGRDAAGLEAGELVMPGISPDADLSEVVTGAKPARTDDQQITLFKSVGMAIQDAVSAAFVLEEANRLGLGTEFDMMGR
jgi:alanine dehydrogenase